MIKVIINSEGSGDWIVVTDDEGNELFSGHRISAMDLVSIFEQLGLEADLVPITDEQMEEGDY